MSPVFLRMARVEYGWLNLFTFNSVFQSSNIVFFLILAFILFCDCVKL